MKKFVLTFDIVDRAHPGRIVVTAIAEKEAAARHMASRQNLERAGDGAVWLDAAQTSCMVRATRKTEAGVDSIQMF